MRSIPVSAIKWFLAALLLLCPLACCKKSKPSNKEDVQKTLLLAFPGLDTLDVERLSIIPYRNNTPGELVSLPEINHGGNDVIFCDDLRLPAGASSALVYAQAIKRGSPTVSSVEDKLRYGILEATGLSGTTSPDDIRFSPVPVFSGVSEKESQLIAILNAVADVTPESALSDGTKPHFKEITEAQSSTINGLWRTIKEAPIVSSLHIEWSLKELYMNLDGLSTPAALNTVPDGYSMAVAIRKLLKNYMDVVVEYGVTTACYLKSEYHGFPAEVNLPEGAVRITYNASSGQFEAKQKADYVFPANRQFFADSPLRETREALPSGLVDKPWNDILKAFSPVPVKRSSVAVAVEKPICPALTELTVQVEGLDSHAIYKDSADNEVDVTNGFQLTSILVGGQKTVSGDFRPVGTKEYTIYAPNYNATTAASATVKRDQPFAKPWLANLLPSDLSSINIALEFLNNCPDFVGKDGVIIPNSAIFYLPVTLKSSDDSPLLTSAAQVTAFLTILPETTLAHAMLEAPDLDTSKDYDGSFTVSIYR